MKKISIIITTRNRHDDLLSCLKSISQSIYQNLNYEIIVVDDASTDNTDKIKINQYSLKNLKIIRNCKQEMMVRSRNKGAAEATGEFLLFIDDDNIIESDMIKKLIKFADANPDYAVIGPKMCYYPSGRPYLCYQKFNFFTGRTTAYKKTTHETVIDSDGIPNVFLVRKNYMDKFGYFDEDIVQTYTEPDYAFSALQRGYKCGIVQDALTYHKILETKGAVHLGGHQFNQKAYFLMRNRTLMIIRYGKSYQQITYLLFFSWLWPIIYSLLVLRESRFDLIKLYWLGFYDGFKLFITRRLPSYSIAIAKLKDI
jgi:glycosyltransferase involved in cell wall biosynthesis